MYELLFYKILTCFYKIITLHINNIISANLIDSKDAELTLRNVRKPISIYMLGTRTSEFLL